MGFCIQLHVNFLNFEYKILVEAEEMERQNIICNDDSLKILISDSLVQVSSISSQSLFIRLSIYIMELLSLGWDNVKTTQILKGGSPVVVHLGFFLRIHFLIKVTYANCEKKSNGTDSYRVKVRTPPPPCSRLIHQRQPSLSPFSHSPSAIFYI